MEAPDGQVGDGAQRAWTCLYVVITGQFRGVMTSSESLRPFPVVSVRMMTGWSPKSFNKHLQVPPCVAFKTQHVNRQIHG